MRQNLIKNLNLLKVRAPLVQVTQKVHNFLWTHPEFRVNSLKPLFGLLNKKAVKFSFMKRLLIPFSKQKKKVWICYLRRKWLKRFRRKLYPSLNSFLALPVETQNVFPVKYRVFKSQGLLDDLWQFQQLFWRRLIRRKLHYRVLRYTSNASDNVIKKWNSSADLDLSKVLFYRGRNWWSFFFNKQHPLWALSKDLERNGGCKTNSLLFWKWNLKQNTKGFLRTVPPYFNMGNRTASVYWYSQRIKLVRKNSIFRNASLFRYARFKGRLFFKKLKKAPKASRRLRRKLRMKLFFTKKFLFKKIFNKFFVFPFVNWLSITHRRVRKNKRVHVRALWKAFDVYLRRYYFYDLSLKKMADLWVLNQAGRFDKILALRQRFVLSLPVLLVLSKFVPNIRTSTLLLKQGAVFIDGKLHNSMTAVPLYSSFYLNPFIFYSLIKWSLFTKEFLRYKLWVKKMWRSFKVRPLVSTQSLFSQRTSAFPWIFTTEDGSSYSPAHLVKISSDKWDLWSRINPWVWNLSFLPVPGFLEISSKFLVGIVFRLPYSYEIVPYSQFSDRMVRWYVRKFINVKVLRSKSFEIWKQFRVRRRF